MFTRTRDNNGRKKVMWGYVSLFSLVLPLVLGTLGEAATQYPGREITLIVPWSSGGPSDTLSRFLAEPLSKILGKTFIVTNKPGGGGTVGLQQVAAAKPDGYTLGLMTRSLILQKYTSPVGMNYENYEPIALLVASPGCLVVNAERPWKSARELIKYARENPKAVKVSNTGTGATWHTFGISLEKASNIKLTHVPYGGGRPALVAVMGGHVDASLMDMPSVHPLMPTGKLRLLGVATEKRHPFYPDVPTFKEEGISVNWEHWTGIVAPKGTPADIVKILSDAFAKAGKDAKYKEFVKNRAFIEMYRNPKEYRQIMENDDREISKILKK
jgi:tripartite-type tricarboxylate transporter receptor subunit TctC